jgi:hypothetical protein
MLSLTSDGQALTVGAKWLQQLQEQVGGEGQSPHKSNPEQVPPHMDSVLEWVYGMNLNAGIVSVVPAAAALAHFLMLDSVLIVLVRGSISSMIIISYRAVNDT